MTSLRDYIAHYRLDETAVLNLLQDHGIISDQCVTAEDCGDAARAIPWLHERLETLPTAP